MKISQQDLAEWRHHPVTKEIFQFLDRLVEQSKDRWCSVSWDGGALIQDQEALFQLAQDRAYLKGQVEAFKDIIDIKAEDLNEEESSEHIGD